MCELKVSKQIIYSCKLSRNFFKKVVKQIWKMVCPTCPTFLSNSRKFLKETWSIFGKGKPLANFAEIKNDQYCQFTKHLIHQIFIVCLKCKSCHKTTMVTTSRSNSFNQFLAEVSIFIPLESIKKPFVFWCFQGV